MKKTGIAGLFAASLELTKEGIIQIMQKMFDKVLIKNKWLKNNIIKFPDKLSKLERKIEAILFAASEPLELETIEKRIETKNNVENILKNAR